MIHQLGDAEVLLSEAGCGRGVGGRNGAAGVVPEREGFATCGELAAVGADHEQALAAARAYGAGNLRIVLAYMLPRAVPVLLPQFVTLIPSFVFLEATLDIVGLGDPLLPTWGKVLDDAYRAGALFGGYYYWVLQPAALLMLSGLGFAMLGFALDRVFNPRLREL